MGDNLDDAGASLLHTKETPSFPAADDSMQKSMNEMASNNGWDIPGDPLRPDSALSFAAAGDNIYNEFIIPPVPLLTLSPEQTASSHATMPSILTAPLPLSSGWETESTNLNLETVTNAAWDQYFPVQSGSAANTPKSDVAEEALFKLGGAETKFAATDGRKKPPTLPASSKLSEVGEIDGWTARADTSWDAQLLRFNNGSNFSGSTGGGALSKLSAMPSKSSTMANGELSSAENSFALPTHLKTSGHPSVSTSNSRQPSGPNNNGDNWSMVDEGSIPEFNPSTSHNDAWGRDSEIKNNSTNASRSNMNARDSFAPRPSKQSSAESDKTMNDSGGWSAFAATPVQSSDSREDNSGWGCVAIADENQSKSVATVDIWESVVTPDVPSEQEASSGRKIRKIAFYADQPRTNSQRKNSTGSSSPDNSKDRAAQRDSKDSSTRHGSKNIRDSSSSRNAGGFLPSGDTRNSRDFSLPRDPRDFPLPKDPHKHLPPRDPRDPRASKASSLQNDAKIDNQSQKVFEISYPPPERIPKLSTSDLNSHTHSNRHDDARLPSHGAHSGRKQLHTAASERKNSTLLEVGGWDSFVSTGNDVWDVDSLVGSKKAPQTLSVDGWKSLPDAILNSEAPTFSTAGSSGRMGANSGGSRAASNSSSSTNSSGHSRSHRLPSNFLDRRNSTQSATAKYSELNDAHRSKQRGRDSAPHHSHDRLRNQTRPPDPSHKHARRRSELENVPKDRTSHFSHKEVAKESHPPTSHQSPRSNPPDATHAPLDDFFGKTHASRLKLIQDDKSTVVDSPSKSPKISQLFGVTNDKVAANHSMRFSPIRLPTSSDRNDAVTNNVSLSPSSSHSVSPQFSPEHPTSSSSSSSSPRSPVPHVPSRHIFREDDPVDSAASPHSSRNHGHSRSSAHHHDVESEKASSCKQRYPVTHRSQPSKPPSSVFTESFSRLNAPSAPTGHPPLDPRKQLQMKMVTI